MSLTTPDKIRSLHRKLYLQAKAEQDAESGDPAPPGSAVGRVVNKVGSSQACKISGLPSD